MSAPCWCFACGAIVAAEQLGPHQFCRACAERAARGRRRFLVVALGLGIMKPETAAEQIRRELEREGE